MEPPEVKEHSWIKLGPNEPGRDRLDAYVLRVYSPSKLSVGYYQNQLKAIKEDVIWTGTHWKFEIDGPCGSYLRGHEEAIVKRGPPIGSFGQRA